MELTEWALEPGVQIPVLLLTSYVTLASYLTSGTYSRHCQFLVPISSHPLHIPIQSSPTFHGQHLHLCWRAILGPPELNLSVYMKAESSGGSLWPTTDRYGGINAPAPLPLVWDNFHACVLHHFPEFPAGLSSIHSPEQLWLNNVPVIAAFFPTHLSIKYLHSDPCLKNCILFVHSS